MLHKQGLKTEFLHYKVKRQDKRNWAYLNFLQTQDIILVPILGVEEDEQAMEQLGNFFPTYHKNGTIIPLRSEEIIKHGGALNCISWTVEEF